MKQSLYETVAKVSTCKDFLEIIIYKTIPVNKKIYIPKFDRTSLRVIK